MLVDLTLEDVRVLRGLLFGTLNADRASLESLARTRRKLSAVYDAMTATGALRCEHCGEIVTGELIANHSADMRRCADACD